MTSTVSARTLDAWLADGREIALLDVREHGQYGEGHPFFAVNLPYSRLELEAPRLLPRADVRIVLLDDGDGDGVAGLAARRLAGLGYTALHLLQGGAPAWAQAGNELFKGVNVPSKTFGELIEQRQATPHLSARELHRMQQQGEPMLLIDGRTLEEHRKQTIPGAIPIPNGELAARLDTVLASPATPVVVHCAGRTRSIIGAQTLRNLGLPNPVLALENGTQGWQLAGLELERGSSRTSPATTARPAGWRARAAALAERHGAPCLDARAAQDWLDDDARTAYVFDVRSPEEFARGSLTGARSAPGGQLIQATDLSIAIRGSRVLLLDDDAIRAPIAASWLRQLGYEAATVEGGIDAALSVPVRVCPALAPTPPALDAAQLADGAFDLILDLRSSQAHRQDSPAGSIWATRPRLSGLAAQGRRVLLLAEDTALAALAALDLREAGAAGVVRASWADWLAAGLPRAGARAEPVAAQAIDTLFFVHDRHDGNLESARRYLAWETGLLSQCRPQELAAFRLPSAD